MTSVQNVDILCLDGNAEISLDINTVIQGHCQQHAENNITISFLYVGRIIGNIPNTLRWSVTVGIGLPSAIMLFTSNIKLPYYLKNISRQRELNCFLPLKINMKHTWPSTVNSSLLQNCSFLSNYFCPSKALQ